MYRLILSILLLSFHIAAHAVETYQTPADFLAEVFNSHIPKAKKIWITGDVKVQVSKILRHSPKALRLRYWANKEKSVWVLNEVGKQRDITVGVVIKNKRIEKIKVLVFRESRGSEVRHDYFTQQFKQVHLINNRKLSKNIDGVTGATLSVRALKKIAILALYLNTQIKI